MSVAGVARRQNRRAGYGYGGLGYGAGVAAAAVTGAAAANATGWGWNQPYYGGGYGYGGGWGTAYPGYGGYANTSYVTGRPTLFPRYYGGGWGTGYGAYAASGWNTPGVGVPYDASVYGQGGPYGVVPGTCYRDCDNYRKALIESGFNPKDYYTKAGTMKQTAY
jgi:hypothetical protein